MMAIVHAADGVRFAATALSPDALLAQVAEYVRGRCENVLWADTAAEVRTLLDVGNLRAAITLFFERTGERWDQERLEVMGMTAGSGPDSTAEGERMADARR